MTKFEVWTNSEPSDVNADREKIIRVKSYFWEKILYKMPEKEVDDALLELSTIVKDDLKNPKFKKAFLFMSELSLLFFNNDEISKDEFSEYLKAPDFGLTECKSKIITTRIKELFDKYYSDNEILEAYKKNIRLFILEFREGNINKEYTEECLKTFGIRLTDCISITKLNIGLNRKKWLDLIKASPDLFLVIPKAFLNDKEFVSIFKKYIMDSNAEKLDVLLFERNFPVSAIDRAIYKCLLEKLGYYRILSLNESLLKNGVYPYKYASSKEIFNFIMNKGKPCSYKAVSTELKTFYGDAPIPAAFLKLCTNTSDVSLIKGVGCVLEEGNDIIFNNLSDSDKKTYISFTKKLMKIKNGAFKKDSPLSDIISNIPGKDIVRDVQLFTAYSNAAKENEKLHLHLTSTDDAKNFFSGISRLNGYLPTNVDFEIQDIKEFLGWLNTFVVGFGYGTQVMAALSIVLKCTKNVSIIDILKEYPNILKIFILYPHNIKVDNLELTNIVLNSSSIDRLTIGTFFSDIIETKTIYSSDELFLNLIKKSEKYGKEITNILLSKVDFLMIPDTVMLYLEASYSIKRRIYVE